MKSALTVVLFRLFTIGVFVDGKEASHVLVIEGDSVSLKPGFTDVQTDDRIEWRFNGNRIDKFVDGLQRDSKTGDLKISNIRTTDSGLYKVKISSSRGSSVMEFNVTVVSADEAKSVSVMEGYSVTLRTDLTEIQRDDVIRWRFGLQKSLVAEINRAAEIFNTYDGPDERFRGRLTLDHQTGSLTITNIRTTDSGLYEAEISSTRSKHTIHYTQSFSVTVSDVESVSVLMGDSVTLRTGLTKRQIIKKILWKFGDQDIAGLIDHQTGDLTIKNIQRDQCGYYKVEINTTTMILHRKYQIIGVFGEVMSVMKGNRVTLNTGVTKNPDDIFQWYFEDTLIALVNRHPDTSCLYYGKDEIFKDRLEVDYATGSLIITTFRPEHTGRYQAEFIEGKPGKTKTIIRSSKCERTQTYPKGSDLVIQKSFILTVRDEVMSVMKGNRVTLNTGVTKNPDDTFQWYFEYTLIAQINRHPDTSCLYYGEGEIFKDRLDVDYKTGSLIITTSRPEHTGRYQAEFIKHDNTGKTKTIIRSSKCERTKTYPKGSDLVIQKSFILTVSGSGLSPGVVAGIVVAVVVLLQVAAGFVCCRRKNSEPERQRVENGGNRNTQNTDDHATEETNLDDP